MSRNTEIRGCMGCPLVNVSEDNYDCNHPDTGMTYGLNSNLVDNEPEYKPDWCPLIKSELVIKLI